MKRVLKSFVLVLLLMFIIVVACACDKTQETSEEPVITIAMYCPTTGDVSRYGEVLGNSLKLACKMINEDGGLKIGDTTYLFDCKVYDNGFYEPSKQAAAVQEAILKDGLDFSFGTYTSDVVKACADHIQNNQHLYISWGMGYLSDDYDYIISALSGPQAGVVGVISWLMKEYNLSKVAILQEDSALGATLQEWDEIATEMNGGEVVYNTLYAGSTKDYTALFQSIVNSGAEIVEIGAVSGATQALMLEAARSVGYDGYFVAHEWVLGDIESHDPTLIEYINDKAFFPTMDYTSKGAPELAAQFYDLYVEEYGQEAWESFAIYPYENFLLLITGLEAAGTPDPTKVRDALVGMDKVDHPLFGECTWWGEAMYGWDCVLLTPASISVVSNGQKSFLEFYDLADDMLLFSVSISRSNSRGTGIWSLFPGLKQCKATYVALHC